MNRNRTSFSYQIGGSLASNSPCYVERKSDGELESALKNGEFCYVLNSRQMGKSSLRVRVMSRLQAEGIICIFVDLTGMGTQDLTADKWYAGIVLAIVRSCKLEFDWRDWWREQRDLLSPVQRLGLFIESVLLVEVQKPIVIFIDEIDRVLSQKFSLDNFLHLIHSCYQKRQSNSDYYRLTFTLLGVAAPRDLIRDQTKSPFELGKAICLQGFKLKEASPLTFGWVDKIDRPQEILAEILAWTNGQPFLTQKLCQLTIKEDAYESLIQSSSSVQAEGSKIKEMITDIVDRYIVDDWETRDEPEHLKTIRDRLCYRNSASIVRLLGLYRDILQHKTVSADRSREQIELRLSGLVIVRQGKLEVNNLIYARVFDLVWVDEQLSQLRPYSQAIFNWAATNNPTYLLQGESLQSALTWSLGKSLADLDYQFLVASQELAKQEIKNTLVAVESASQLLANTRKKAQHKANNQRLSKKYLASISLGVTGFILLLRCTGVLQTWEWNLLDSFFRWRVSNAIEPRIVVVTISEQDLNKVGQIPIPDDTLAQAINQIKANQPKAIALDLYRDLPVPPGSQNLQKIFNSTPNLYLVEKAVGKSIPPPKIDPSRVGFIDLVLDSDGKVRRALLSLVDKNRRTKFSLDVKLALDYLAERQIKLEPLNNNRYRLGKAIFQRFTANSGGYVDADAGGYQILLNYWGTAANFQQYSLTEVLNQQIAAENIRDRIIYIGSTAESIKDSFYTPYSKGWFRSPAKMPGVFIHANITSQIIGAALDNRPLLRTYNKFPESFSILMLAVVGITIYYKTQRTSLILLSLSITIICLMIVCYLAFLLGWWLPLIPALLTLVATVITAILISNKQRDRALFQYTLAFLIAEFYARPIVARIALEYFKQSSSKGNSYLIEKQIKKIRN